MANILITDHTAGTRERAGATLHIPWLVGSGVDAVVVSLVESALICFSDCRLEPHRWRSSDRISRIYS